MRGLQRSTMESFLLLPALGLALAVCATPCAAAEAVGLADVVQAAARGSPAVKREDEKVRLASGELQQAEGAFDWNGTAESGWQRFYAPKIRNGYLSSELISGGTYQTTLGVEHTFTNGITVEPGVSFFADSNVTAAQTLGATEPRPSLNVKVPLLRGLGDDNPLAANARAAQSTLDGSKYGRDFMAQRAVAEAVQLYWRCLAAHDALDIVDADQRSSDDYVASLRMLLAQGRIEPTVLNRAIGNQAIDRIEHGKAAADDEHCRRDLGVALGGSDRSIPAVTGDFPAMDALADSAAKLSDQALADMALQNRQDLRALEHYEIAQADKLKAAEDGQRPKLDLYLDPYKVMLRLTQSLGGDLEQGQLTVAEAGHNQAQIDLEQLRSQIYRDIADIRQSLAQALTNWADLNHSAALLQDVVTNGEQQQKAATITHEEYRAMQRELANVRRQMIDAKLQFAFGLAQLRLATGTIEAAAGTPPETAATVFRSLAGL